MYWIGYPNHKKKNLFLILDRIYSVLKYSLRPHHKPSQSKRNNVRKESCRYFSYSDSAWIMPFGVQIGFWGSVNCGMTNQRLPWSSWWQHQRQSPAEGHRALCRGASGSQSLPFPTRCSPRIASWLTASPTDCSCWKSWIATLNKFEANSDEGSS